MDRLRLEAKIQKNSTNSWGFVRLDESSICILHYISSYLGYTLIYLHFPPPISSLPFFFDIFSSSSHFQSLNACSGSLYNLGSLRLQQGERQLLLHFAH
jgi:hypothetical protein